MTNFLDQSSDAWWDKFDFAAIGESSIDCNWAAQALSIEALRAGNDVTVTVYDNQMEGVLIGTVEETVAKLTALTSARSCGYPGRVVCKSPLWRGDTSSRLFIVWPDGMVGLWLNDGDLEGRVVSIDPVFFEAAKGILETHIGPKASAGRVYVLMSTDEGPELKSIGVAAVPLERGNYNLEPLDGFDAVVADIASDKPSGRLAILDGDPGTGKTFMIRGFLAAAPDALFVVVPAHLIPTLADPGMINALLETRRNKGDHPTVFLVEDADDCLVARDASNVNSVSALLNLADGILGSLMDIRLICTTNLKGSELDPAIVREGRLSRLIHVGPLGRDVREALYRRLTGVKVTIDEKLTLAQVYSLARVDGWKPVQKARSMGFQSSSVTLSGPDGSSFEIEGASPSLAIQLTKGF